MLQKLFQREQQGDARYQGGLSRAWHVVRFDYGMAFNIFIIATALSLLYVSLNTGAWFVHDRSYVTLVFARNLLRSGTFTFDGVHGGYGMVSPLHVGLIALITLVTRRVDVASILLGIVTLSTAGIFAYYWAKEVLGRRAIASVGGLLFVTSGWMLFDALAGVETMLFIMLLFITLYLYERRSCWFGLPLGLAVMTRPDGWFFVIGLVLHALFSVPAPNDGTPPAPAARRKVLLGFGICLLTLLPHLILSRTRPALILPGGDPAWPRFFGDLARPFAEQVRLFAAGLGRFWAADAVPFPGLLLIGLVFARRFYRAWYLPVAALGFYATCLFQSPGALQRDWSQVQHVFLPFVLLAVADGVFELGGLLRAADRGRRPLVIIILLALALAGNQVMSVLNQRRTYAGVMRSAREVTERLAQYVRAGTRRGDLVATTDIGIVAHLTRRPVLDLTGVINPDVSEHLRPPPAQRNLTGYLTGRNPRLVLLREGWHSCLNLTPGRPPDGFELRGKTRPVYPGTDGGYYIYANADRTAAPDTLRRRQPPSETP